jgi:hypothetical protein
VSHVPPSGAPPVRHAAEVARFKGRSIRWSARSRLADYPALFLPLARMRHPESVVSAKTELLIDGFTRSAVTFAVIGFQLAQRRPVRVAHTLHAAGHVIAGVRRGVPTLVTIRDPQDAVLSAIIREPHVDARQALAAYARFYERLRPYRSEFVVGRFGDVTQDLGSVIERVNARFSTRFDRFDHMGRDVEECFQIIEDRAQWPPWWRALGEFESGIIGIAEYRRIVAETRGSWIGQTPEMRVQRPSPTREAVKRARRSSLEHPRLDELRARACRAYEAMIYD